jgi:hypothetical protein
MSCINVRWVFRTTISYEKVSHLFRDRAKFVLHQVPETVPDDAAQLALRGRRPAQGGAGAGAKGTGEGGAVEPEQLVAIGDAPGVLLAFVTAGPLLDALLVLLEPLHRPVAAVHLEDPVDPAHRRLLPQPARLEDDLHDVPARVLGAQL